MISLPQRTRKAQSIFAIWIWNSGLGIGIGIKEKAIEGLFAKKHAAGSAASAVKKPAV
jgi:hypothetical protein